MLETDEISWLWTCMQLKRVQLFVGSLIMSPGCGAEHSVVRASRRPTGKADLNARPHQPSAALGQKVQPAGPEPPGR